MQKIILTMLLISISLFEAIAQGNHKKNIFYSYNEFKNSAVTEAEEKVYLNEFLNQNFITIIKNGKKIKVNKADVYGYSTESSPLIRIWKNNSYILAEQGMIWVYYKERLSPGKGSQRPSKVYYFSVDGDSQILPLTINNLKITFPENHSLHDLLDGIFSNNIDLSAYNSAERTYKINHLLTTLNK